MKRLFILILTVLLLSSCIGTKVHTSLNKDGSGTLVMEFFISQMFFQMGDNGGGGADGVPLTASEITSDFKDIPGVTIREAVEEDTEEMKIIRAIIDFDSFEALAASEMMADATLTKENGSTVYRMEIAEAKEPVPPMEGEADSDMMAATANTVEPFFEGYEINFTFTAPKAVKSYSLGELGEDGRTVVVAMDTLEFTNLKNTEPLIMEVVW